MAHEDRSTLEEIFERPAVGPLAGVVVADLSRVLAGPYCTMLLADLGALVIKVESPGGDDTRRWSPPRRGDDSTYYLSVNRNKYSIALDFKDPADLAVVRRIVDRADVVIQNFKPGGLEKFGLDAATLRQERPDLVYASISGFGTDGGANLPGYDLLVQALSGMMELTGSADGEPMRSGVAVFDVITGLHSALGILAALRVRDETGRGDHVEVNLLSSALSGLVNQTSAYVAGGVVPTRMGNEHPSLYPYEPLPAADKEIVIAVGNDPQFAALCRCLELPELPGDARFATNEARNANRGELRVLLTERLKTRPAADWFELLRAANVPAAPILTVAEGTQFAEQLGLEPVVETGTGERRIPAIRNPIRFSESPLDYSKSAPILDGDRDQVTRWLEATTSGDDAP
ncbi:CaiB/BaiF CoA transferase family protein [Flexivirga oryzae]|uniref:Crotonobetainyl-CoA:carnitine CoA-transferase CaiB-like acyl-CoA transferase n=1 Tax=Flexivirga oryzae TaxID=1794944 RepID=A0A839N787_9MICO|nr:CoA transferase [Flexivirga oryzae]MBB2893620.1 crotonobetainyl-CoA:carnitine CoA-transferase CaiB-like acyl-CoA transferase [Flexivirga oryzae]